MICLILFFLERDIKNTAHKGNATCEIYFLTQSLPFVNITLEIIVTNNYFLTLHKFS